MMDEQQMGIMQIRRGILLISSNIGSLFGEKSTIRKYWLDEIANEVNNCSPSFLALHLQESGGKNYKLHSKEMPGLVGELQRILADLGFSLSRCFLDIQYEIVEEFTALSSLFFIHESMANKIFQYNFRRRKYFSFAEYQEIFGVKTIFTNGLVRSGFVKKEKFSRDFWPSFRFGRKGFLHTRWKIENRIFDLVNIHLFHDESNLNFLENPMQYSNNRRNALNYVLCKFEKFNGGTIEGTSNLFIFGDFNFRLNLSKFVKKLTNQTSEREVLLCSNNPRARNLHSVSDSSCGNASSLGEESSEESALSQSPSLLTEPSASSSETDDFRTSCDDFEEINEDLTASLMRRKNSVIEYYKPVVREYLSPSDNPGGNVSWVLRIGRKRFDYYEPGWFLREWRSYKEDDCEPKAFPLRELEPDFPPTYPWNEDSSAHQLMNTRAPAWCDRILFNENAWKRLVEPKESNHSYRSFGMDNCIGDHKPVLLTFTLPT